MSWNDSLSPSWLAIIIPSLALLSVALWWLFGPNARRGRILRRLRQLLQQGKWSEVLQRLERIHKNALPRRWQKRFDDLEADCLEAAVAKALTEKDFDEALNLSRTMVDLRGLAEATAAASVQAAMLQEMRRLFAVGSARGVYELAARPLLASKREAAFWQALCFLREGQTDRALLSLQEAARDEVGETRDKQKEDESSRKYIDPLLYLGALLLRNGQAKEALRLLTEANRIDNSCPVVTAQLGSAMMAAGADAGFAVRTLKRALGPKGLAQWIDNPARVWIEAFPERHSCIHKLAVKHTFVCPLWGSDVQPMVRQARLALAQGLSRLGNYQEAADLFQQLLEEGAPSATVLRGLGISLARIGRYDDAFKHLRIAHEIEEPKDRLTAGYLALCGARGKPSQPEAKVQNVIWAMRLVSLFNAPHDAEWAGIISELFAEAREHNIPLSLDDQLYLCEHLCSVHATDARAAQAFRYLRRTFPEAVRPEYSWLFCRAIQQHGLAMNANGHADTLELFALNFAHEEEARAFYKERDWDFNAVEIAFLTLTAKLAPGSFPFSLGPDYPARGQQLLLASSREHEKVGRLDQALESAEVLVQLMPNNPLAFDRLALLHYRLNQRDQALDVLRRWQTFDPQDPVPLIRQAVFLYQTGHTGQGREKVHQALHLSHDQQKGDFAVWGARLALHHDCMMPQDVSTGFRPDALQTAREFLEEGLHGCPDHVQLLECLAAVRWLLGDLSALASQSAAMKQPEVGDAKFHYFAGLCHWAAGDMNDTLQACQLVNPTAKQSDAVFSLSHANGDNSKASLDVNLHVESSFLAGLAQHKLEDWSDAQTALEMVAKTNTSPSAPLAQAMLGGVCLAQDNFEQAVCWWQALDAKKRAQWQLAEPLANTIFLSALTAFQAGKFEEAADKFRAAGKLGCRDRRLGPLLILSLFRAGQTAFYGTR